MPLGNRALSAARALGRRLARRVTTTAPAAGLSEAEQVSQLLLIQQYQRLLLDGATLPRFDEVEFRAYSQNGEDGILLFVFAVIGATSKRAIEICAGDGVECNAANLVINHGWEALLVDGDRELVERGRQFYASHKNVWVWPPRQVHAWVTAESVNDIVRSNGFAGEIDLLSLDLDGMDYWVWSALDCASPRVVVAEYQTGWGPEIAKVVRYDPHFRLKTTSSGPIFGAGGSLAAFVRLAERKGYRLVGSQRYGFNAFFVRNDIAPDLLPRIAPSACFAHPHAQQVIARAAEALAAYDWCDV